MKIGLILLAAGGSARLGSPKQLLCYRGVSLLRHSAQVALESACRPVAVVLGAGAGSLRVELRDLDVHAVENPGWARGMGSSIRMGMKALASPAEPPEAVALMLCDQPLVTARSLDALAAEIKSGSPIAACAYEGSIGVPAIFCSRYFDELLALPDDAGAKRLLIAHRAEVTALPAPEAAVDIDTPAEYARLTAREQQQ